MVEFKGDVDAVQAVIDGLNVIDVEPMKLVCGCYVENVDRIAFKNTVFIEERTCNMVCKKDGPMCTVWEFDCCGFEFVEDKCAQYQTDLPGTRCPKCGAKVIADD